MITMIIIRKGIENNVIVTSRAEDDIELIRDMYVKKYGAENVTIKKQEELEENERTRKSFGVIIDEILKNY